MSEAFTVWEFEYLRSADMPPDCGEIYKKGLSKPSEKDVFCHATDIISITDLLFYTKDFRIRSVIQSGDVL
jgi:hypothetical protein